MKAADQPVSAVVPLLVTVSWSWYPPDHELVTDDVSVQVPLPDDGVGDGGVTGPVDVV
jgi:hypothetical protein